MWADLSGQLALVTGGTRGLGLAIGLALGERGAQVVLTYRWGGADEDELRREFAARGAPEPWIVEADAASPDDTTRVLEQIAAKGHKVDILISNVAVVSRGGSLEALKRRDLLASLRYSAWPTVGYVDAIEQRFGELPRYVIATSSDGPDHHYPGYDYVAASKAALEAIAQDLASRTAGTRTRVNVLRTRQIATQGYADVFPPKARALIEAHFDRFSVTLDEAGAAAVALTSGLLDGLHGQVLVVDKGAEYLDNVMTTAPVLLGALT